MAEKRQQTLRAALRIHERRLISYALNKYGWDVAKTAKDLGIALSTLYRKMVELKIKRR